MYMTLYSLNGGCSSGIPLITLDCWSQRPRTEV